MMNKLLLILILFFCSGVAIAQNKYHDVIILKNGSIIKGTIIKRIPNESITILVSGREAVTFYFEEIKKLDKEGRIDFDSQSKDKGYFSRNEMGASFRKNKDWQGSYTTILPWFQTVHGYKWNQYLETGLGVGTDFYETVITVPFFVNISGELMKSKVTPTYVLQYGDSFILNEEQVRMGNTQVKGKNFFRMGLGIQINNPVNAFYITAGFKLNKVQFTDSWWDQYYYQTTRLYRSFALGFGMKF